MDIIKKEGAKADVFNGQKMATVVDKEQYVEDRQPVTKKIEYDG